MRNSGFFDILPSVCAMVMFAVNSVAQAAPPPPAPPQPSGEIHLKTTPQDSSQWRRNPFITQEKKEITPAAKPSAVPRTVIGGAPYKIAAKTEQPHEIDLQGIMQVGNSYHALINGRIVKPGDTLDGMTIRQIKRHSVSIEDKTDRRTYDIYQGRIDRGTP